MNKIVTCLNSNEYYNLDKFFKNQFPDSYRYGTMGYFFWKINLNPYKIGIVNVIEDEKTISASTTITPKLLILNNECIDAAEIGDTYTDKKFQGKGYFASLVNETSKNALDLNTRFIFGTPNYLSLPVYIKRTNFGIVNDFIIQSYFYNLKLNIFPNAYLGKLLFSTLNIFYENFVKARIKVNLFLSNNSRSINIEKIDFLDEDFDIFWNKAKLEWNFIFDRNYKSLKWRFFDNPELYNFYIVKIENNVIGYFVYRIFHTGKINRLVIADYLFLKDNEINMNHCLKFIKSISIKENINTIQLWCVNKSPYIKNIFNENFSRANDIPLIMHKNDIILKNLRNIHFTISDSDNV